MVKSVELNTSYEVSDGPITLSIAIGNGQIGSSVVKLDGVELGIGDIDDFAVGLGSDLAGKTLTTKSVVTDTNDKTNQTTIRYVLEGGPTPRTIDQQAKVTEEGASVIYRATFQFTQ